MHNATAVKENQSDSRASKYLTFFLANEEYGVEILKVQEIIGRMPITPVPLNSKYILGVINLRGKIHPIMDLKIKFGMDQSEITDETCIIVIKTASLMVGVLVDKVLEVVNLASEDIEYTPSFGADVNTEYLLGVGKTGERVLLLLVLNVNPGYSLQDIQDSCGFELLWADKITDTDPPHADELRILRDEVDPQRYIIGR
jgi:purine-binding chemotaxis protein CheW